MPRHRSGLRLGHDRAPRTPWHDTVIYEVHVRGMTMRHPQVPPALRGTYAGLATAPVIDHLKRLGVTAVELMPVHAFLDDRHLLRAGTAQLLGLQHHRFLRARAALHRQRPGREFKTMVKTPARRRHRGHPRRRLQPHRRRQRARPDPVVPRHRQAAYYRLGRTNRATTWTSPAPATRSICTPARAADDHGLACATGCSEMHVDGFRFDLGLRARRANSRLRPAAASSTPSPRTRCSRRSS